LLYGDEAKARPSEWEWVRLVDAIAAGDQLALHALYERTSLVAFTLIVRITNDRETAEEVTLDVFHDLWRDASTYHAASGTVLRWIMGQARSRALARRAEPRGSAALGPQTAPSPSLWSRLARRVAADPGWEPSPPARRRWPEPEWEEVAPGIFCQLLATDGVRDRVSMLVRLAPGIAYPPHVHAGVEELFLLDGELWIDDRTLLPGDYNEAEAGTADQRVWSPTGCTCLLITSTRDRLR
jgi:DNA-directed RNA polymerase specialized sigma24 family protein